MTGRSQSSEIAAWTWWLKSLSIYKTAGNLVTLLYQEGSVTKKALEVRAETGNDSSADSLEGKFVEFGELSSAFVKKVSSAEALSYRGEPGTVEENLNVTKKVFSKWSIEILMSTYSVKSVGFGDLKRLLNGISSRVLSKKLKDLEEMGFIEREVIESRPPKVKYSLSKRGEVLAKLGEPVILYLRESLGRSRPRKA